MSTSKSCKLCNGDGLNEDHLPCLCIQPPSFDALHMVYHERDFRVRVNDPTINFVKRILGQEVGLPKLGESLGGTCPACEAGYDLFVLQPNKMDDR